MTGEIAPREQQPCVVYRAVFQARKEQSAT
jgi:hypothetical protein